MCILLWANRCRQRRKQALPVLQQALGTPNGSARACFTLPAALASAAYSSAITHTALKQARTGYLARSATDIRVQLLAAGYDVRDTEVSLSVLNGLPEKSMP